MIDIWLTVLQHNLDKLGNEKYIIIEQVLMAALDCHQSKIISKCYNILLKTFGRTSRVLKYEGATKEMLGEYVDAISFYGNSYLPSNPIPKKRSVAMFKAKGCIPQAIKELVDYLKLFISDVEGWQELCGLYLQVQDYPKAVFCAEELLLHQPHSHLYHQQVADIRYTMGGQENAELAKLYYSHALKLNPQNMRALLGLFLATNALINFYKSGGSASKRKEVLKMNQWTLEQASKSYRDNDVFGPIPGNTDEPQLDALLNSLSVE